MSNELANDVRKRETIVFVYANRLCFREPETMAS